MPAERSHCWYRMLAVLMQRKGYKDNIKRICRVYREEKLQVKIRRRCKTARWRGDKPVPATSPNEFTGKALDRWVWEHCVQLAFIEPGKPVQNAFVESFNGTCFSFHRIRFVPFRTLHRVAKSGSKVQKNCAETKRNSCF